MVKNGKQCVGGLSGDESGVEWYLPGLVPPSEVFRLLRVLLVDGGSSTDEESVVRMTFTHLRRQPKASVRRVGSCITGFCDS
jgi:hypothetical protein